MKEEDIIKAIAGKCHNDLAAKEAASEIVKLLEGEKVKLEEERERFGELVRSVAMMRARQNTYFSNRNSLNLDIAKRWEQTVDRLIDKEIKIGKEAVRQGNMF